MSNPTTTSSVPSAPPVASSSSCKTVYLIRHAESLENQRIQSVKRTFSTLGKFRLPSSKDVSTSMELMNVRAQVDTDVSSKGKEQILKAAQLLQHDNFIHDIELIVHSPLKRARETCQGMLGCSYSATETTSTETEDNTLRSQHDTDGRSRRVLESHHLSEKTPEEWIPGKTQSFKNRIHQFEQWLSQQPERVVAIVGHSQYFKAMLGLSYKFGNCDVWQVQFVDNHQDNNNDDSENTIVMDNKKRKNKNNKQQKGDNTCTADLPRGWRSLKRIYSIHDDNGDTNPVTDDDTKMSSPLEK